MTAPEDNVVSDSDFYIWTRNQIEHEDGLINNRMTWLLTLQAFLFGAYGFSISARAVLAAAYIEKHPEIRLDDSDMVKLTTAFVADARTGLGLMACFSAIALLIGIAAAASSMEKLIQSWEAKPIETQNKYPQIIGRPFKHSGIYLGLMPTYLVPLLSTVVWVYLVQTWIVDAAFIGVLVTATGTLVYLSGVKEGRLQALRSNESLSEPY